MGTCPTVITQCTWYENDEMFFHCLRALQVLTQRTENRLYLCWVIFSRFWGSPWRSTCPASSLELSAKPPTWHTIRCKFFAHRSCAFHLKLPPAVALENCMPWSTWKQKQDGRYQMITLLLESILTSIQICSPIRTPLAGLQLDDTMENLVPGKGDESLTNSTLLQNIRVI